MNEEGDIRDHDDFEFRTHKRKLHKSSSQVLASKLGLLKPSLEQRQKQSRNMRRLKMFLMKPEIMRKNAHKQLDDMIHDKEFEGVRSLDVAKFRENSSSWDHDSGQNFAGGARDLLNGSVLKPGVGRDKHGRPKVSRSRLL